MLENLTPDQINNLISAGSGLLGAVIGAGATLLSTWLSRKMQMSGKITLHIRNVHSQKGTNETFGYYHDQLKSVLFLDVPVWLDVCNTSGISRVVRDVNLYAYKNKQEVAEFTQAQAVGDDKKRISLGENEAYTLVVPAHSAKRFSLEFVLDEDTLSTDDNQFDELVLKYFDEKNKIQAFHFMNIDKCWVSGSVEVEKKWITLDKRCKYAR